MSQQQPN
jgi:RNA recognition motif-containing protein